MAKVKRSYHAQKRKTPWYQKYKWPLLGGVVLLLIVGFVVYAETRPEPGEPVQSLGNQHIQPGQEGSYNSTPPTSGPHYGQLARWGVHSDPIPNELQVHNLEDGGVMVQYNCPDGCEEIVQNLEEIVRQYREGVILAPYPDMDARIALTAWTRIDKFDEFDETRVINFISSYRGIDHHAR